MGHIASRLYNKFIEKGEISRQCKNGSISRGGWDFQSSLKIESILRDDWKHQPSLDQFLDKFFIEPSLEKKRDIFKVVLVVVRIFHGMVGQTGLVLLFGSDSSLAVTVCEIRSPPRAQHGPYSSATL